MLQASLLVFNLKQISQNMISDIVYDIAYDIVYDTEILYENTISYTISYTIFYMISLTDLCKVICGMYLRILVPQSMTCNVKRIKLWIWPSLKQFTFPLDAAERAQMATNNIMNEDSI